MLSINNLSKIFNNKTVLQRINATVKPGEIAVFLGQSGTGKSTLLRILNNLEKPDQGSIMLNGRPLTSEHHTNRIGLVFQQFNLFENLTAQENVELALIQVLKKSPAQASEIAKQLLQQYTLAEQAKKYPRQLSGGQKQRLALIRAIALQPQILCLDEPTSALDPMLTNYVAQTIINLAKQGLSVIVATHDIGLLQKLPCTIYLMEHGAIVEQADSKHFEQQPQQYPKISAFIQGN